MTPFTIVAFIVFLIIITGIYGIIYVFKSDSDELETLIENDAPEVYIKKLAEDAMAPKRNNPTDAGLDFYSYETISIPAGEGKMISTKIAIQLPRNTVGIIQDRSSMGSKGFKVHGGVIDEPYRGEVKIVLWNHSSSDQIISKGDKIAQLVIYPVMYSPAVEVISLSESDRGDKGFGSSGK